MAQQSTTVLEELVGRIYRSSLQPFCFFVSWQGVLTLAYSGFTPELARLKQGIEQLQLGLPRESPGSKWPKTSLACLKDQQRLTPQQLGTLSRLCTTWSKNLQGMQIALDHAAVAVYACRSLERLVSWHAIQFANTDASNAEPSQEEQSKVSQVVAEADHPDYWFSVSKDGNREQHYRGDHIGATLVCGVNAWAEASHGGVQTLSHCLQAFRADVEDVLPGMYTWFSMASLHVTLRALT